MGFLNPLLLLGTLASLIPLLIHLWSRRQAKTVDFSSLRFLLAAHRKSVRRLQIRQWLILLLRMLVVGLLAVAFARPLLKNQFSIAGSRIHTSCVIVLDNSYSMRYEGVRGYRFGLAQEQAVGIAETLQRGDQGSLVLMSNRAEVVFPNLTTDLAQLVQAVRDAEASERMTSVQAGLEAAYRLLETSEDPNKEVYLITDLTKSAWQNWDQSVVKPGIRLFLVPIGEPNAPNISIEEIRMPNPLTGIGLPTKMEVRVRNHDQMRRETLLSFVVDGQKHREVGLTLEAGATLTQTVTHQFDVPGNHTGYAAVQEDRLAIDDRYYFAAQVAGNVRVLCVEDGLPYLTLAIQPESLSSPNQPYLFLPTIIASDALEDTSLASYDIVTVSDLSVLPASSLLKLSTYVQNGGKLLAFLGGEQLQTPLTPLLQVQAGSVIAFDVPQMLSLDEPQLALFAATPPRYFTGSGAPQFYRAHDISVTASAGDAVRVVASLADTPQIPAILMDAHGSVILLNTSLSKREWSTLPLSPSFVALIQQACLHFVDQGTGQMDWEVGVAQELSLPNAEGGRASVRSPDAQEPKTLLLRADRTTDSFVPEQAGIYQLDYASNGTSRQRQYAANVGRVESDLHSYSVDQAMQLLGNAHLLAETQKLREELNQYRTGREIWGHLILLSIVLMMLELFLANRRRSSV